MVAMVPFASPWYADVLRESVVRDLRDRDSTCAFEHLRLTPSSGLHALPGLDCPWRSRIRDSVATALFAGAPSVDLLLVRAEGAGRTDFAHPLVSEQLLSYLPRVPGGIVCLPDAGLGPARDQARVAWMLAQFFEENHVIGLLDAPVDVPWDRLAEALTGTDTALCGWSDSARAQGAHAWRSAAAVVAGRMCADIPEIGRSLCRRRIPLRAAPTPPLSRLVRLTPHVRRPPPETDGAAPLCVTLDFDDLTGAAVIRSEPALRAPVGVWTLPAMQATKAIRRAVSEAAGRHLFRPVTDQEAYALAGGLVSAMRPFIARGVLTGPGGVGVPEVVAAPLRDPAAPGLVATIRGYMRPWMLAVNLSVSVRQGQAANVVEA